MEFLSLRLPVFFLLSVLIAKAPFGDAWGKEGHIMACKIAEPYLTEKTLKAVVDLLPETAGGELSTICPWADTVRFRYRWSSPLHYINTPGVCNYKYSRDCHNSHGEAGMCVAGAINNYTNQLYGYGNPSNQYNLTESLMFLAHFVGDIHQPLHVGFQDDEGGNTIIVHWYRRKTNLHHVWDSSIIETAMRDYYDNDLDTMVEGIKLNITGGWAEDVDNWQNCQNKRATCANDYAEESIKLACDYAYKDAEQNSTLEDDYFFTRLPTVKKRIAQAGLRLALILNRIFDSENSQQIQSY
ncbi:endonuclease 2 [Dendrobium catenatum]|uniref:Aspergillus nuclease S1 n=1 Tax=Dendrobium catenatum TaxID=906689 RepID=A0A2I0WWP8_9ASPA|nr:endonuclease 2 [Dendrobium catenatum]PKU80085.1 Endonuclease 2 [Dendrobium catenatum]